MTLVTPPTGPDFDVTDLEALAYYRREPGYVVHDGVSGPLSLAPLVPAWAAATSYAAGQLVQNPSSPDLFLRRIAAGVSRGSLDATELALWKVSGSGTYAPIAQAQPGNVWVPIGDSLTQHSAGVTAMGDAFPSYAHAFSLGKLRLAANAGVFGNTSAQMLARFDTDVTPYAPNIVTILAGTNDIGQTVPFATYQANIRALVAKCRSIGAVPVIITMPPNSSGSPANRKQLIISWNSWLRRYAAKNFIPLIDAYNFFVDPANGNYLATYVNDGTHWDTLGDHDFGQLVANTLGPIVPPAAMLLANDANDPNNIISNALFLTATANPGVRADGWNNYSGTANGTFTLDGTDTTIKGAWQNFSQNNGQTTSYGVSKSVNYTTANPGDILAFSGLYKSSAFENANSNLTITIQLQDGSFGDLTGSPIHPIQSLHATVSKGWWYVEAVAPTGLAIVSVVATVNGAGGAAGIAQVTGYNLTQNGAIPI